MAFRKKKMLALAVALGALLAPQALAQSAGETFASPVRLKAGDAFLGEKRLYPSPAFHDVNGDGLLDIVVGDLRGILTVALRKPGAPPIAYAAETNLKSADGEDLKFHNW